MATSVWCVECAWSINQMSRRWFAVSRAKRDTEMYIPEMGIRLAVFTRAHRKFVLREFKASGITEAFYTLAFESSPVHTAFEELQTTDLAAAMQLFATHPSFLSWHMLMTHNILDWTAMATYPPFASRYPDVAARVASTSSSECTHASKA